MSPHRPITVLAWPAYAAMANPFTRLLFDELRKLDVGVEEFAPPRVLTSAAGIWHIQGPDHMVNRPSAVSAAVRVATFVALLRVAKLRGMKVVWTINNLASHERWHPTIERVMWWAFARSVDGTIHYSRSGKSEALRRHAVLSRRPAFLIPHGHYRQVYSNDLDAAEARTRLGIPPRASVITYFGNIRSYKNVPLLIREFRKLDDPETWLVVAGKPGDPATLREVLEAADGAPRVRLELRLIPDDEVQVFMNAADLVALPFREILNSGSALLALSFDRPVLVPGLGALTELREHCGDNWVRTFDGDLTANVLRDALRWSATGRRPGHAPVDAWDWGSIARAVRTCYESVLGDVPGSPA